MDCRVINETLDSGWVTPGHTRARALLFGRRILWGLRSARAGTIVAWS
jgi:hypothetical protein